MLSEMDPTLLAAALEGYERQLERLESQIAQVKAITSGGKRATSLPAAQSPSNGARKTRVVSEEARRRMAEAQKKRWAKYHSAK